MAALGIIGLGLIGVGLVYVVFHVLNISFALWAWLMLAGGAWLGYGELMQVSLGGAGLFLGLAVVGRASESGKARERYVPQLLRVAGTTPFEIDSTALTRSRT